MLDEDLDRELPEEETDETEGQEETQNNEKEEEIEETQDNLLTWGDDVFTDDEVFEIEGQKVKWSDIKNLVKQGVITQKQAKQITSEQAEQTTNTKTETKTDDPNTKILQEVIKIEFNRKWDDIKDKYDLVSKEELAYRMAQMAESGKDVSIADDMEKIAESLQKYYEKKLEEKYQKRLEKQNKLANTKISGEGDVNPPKDSGDEIDIDNIESLKKSLNALKNK